MASWAGLSPNREVSGGKVLRSKTRKIRNRVAHAFRMAANSLFKSASALGDAFRRLRARLGAPKAITAMARRLLGIAHHLATNRQEFDARMFERQNAGRSNSASVWYPSRLRETPSDRGRRGSSLEPIQ